MTGSDESRWPECPKHKKYRATKPPTTGCSGCWLKWLAVHSQDLSLLNRLSSHISFGNHGAVYGRDWGLK